MLHGWQYLKPGDRETILRGIEHGDVFGGPYHIEFNWVDKCNARCFFCGSGAADMTSALEFDQARRIIEQAARTGLRSIRLSGGGEPTLHPQFGELLDLLAEHDIVIENLNTNGVQLTPRLIEKLMAVRVGDVRISLNFADAETYGRCMGLPPRFFDRVVRNIEALAEAGRDNPDFGGFSVHFFVFKDTLHQIREMYDLGRRLGARLISLRQIENLDRARQFDKEDLPTMRAQLCSVLRSDWDEGRVEIVLNDNGVKEVVDAIRDRLAAELGDYHGVPRAVDIDMGHRYCYMPWYSLTLTGTTAVYPCCLLTISRRAHMGDLKDMTLDELWRGEPFREVRQEMRRFMMVGDLNGHAPDIEHKRLSPICSTHDKCIFIPSLADDAFYAEAEARLRRVRRRPQHAVRRVLARLKK